MDTPNAALELDTKDQLCLSCCAEVCSLAVLSTTEVC